MKWDPNFSSKPFRNTAQNGGDCMPSKEKREKMLAECMDEYDKAEKDHDGHFFDAKEQIPLKTASPTPSVLKEENQYVDYGFDTTADPFVPMERPDMYDGPSKLRYSNKPIEHDPDIPVHKIGGRESYNNVEYDAIFEPPDEVTEVDITPEKVKSEPHSSSNEPFDDASRSGERGDQDPEPVQIVKRRSPRLNEKKKVKANNVTKSSGKTKWVPSKWNKLYTALALIGACILPTHVMAEPVVEIHNDNAMFETIPMKPISTAQRVEELRAYHLNLDKLNQLLNPDYEDERWWVSKVLNHRVVECNDGHTRVFAKIQYSDGDKSYMTMDALRNHDPLVALRYASKHNLVGKEHWEWVQHYLDDNPFTVTILNVFNTTTENGRKYKFGVEVPRNPKHALALDKAAGNTGWQDSMGLEIGQLNDFQVFKVVPDGEPLPPGYKRIPYQIVFDVKFDGRLKSRLVAGGHRTPDVPREEVFSGVVSMEAVRLGFILAHLNGLQVCAGDIGNAFLNRRTREKVYIIAGPEFGPALEGKRMLVDRSLYGLKTSAARFHEHCSAKLRKMGFKPSKADPDLWIKQLPDGTYEYVAQFVDDLIAFSKNPMDIMKELEKTYVMKGVGKPQYYLGGDVVELPPEWENEQCTTAFSAHTYIKNCIPKLAKMCEKEKFKGYKTPFNDSYHAELDTSPLCDTEKISKYKSLIGSANWIITLGRFDIAYAVSTLSRYSVAPREGHFEAMERVFGYLAKFPHGQLIIDPNDAPIRQLAQFNLGHNWSEFYPDAEEDIPYDMPPSQGKLATWTCYVEADHARDEVTCRSVTGIVMLLNNTPITWISKQQKTVETST